MIKTKKELRFYILADRMMNRGCFTFPVKYRIVRLFAPDYILNYLVSLRKMEYYGQLGGGVF